LAALDQDQTDPVQAVAEHVAGMAEEVEASVDVSVGGSALKTAQAALHRWIDEAKGVVVNPAQGRVTLIHDNGRTSTITSPDLPFIMSARVGDWPGK
jgi:glycerate-2-kinase